MNQVPVEPQYIADLCLRAFPHRDEQYVTAIEYLGAWQHEMTAFTLGWRDGPVWLTEPLILRRFKSRLSWWQVEDREKAQREATVMRWLHDMEVRVPRTHVVESGPDGDILLERRLPGAIWFDIDRSFPRAVAAYIDEYARVLAYIHSLEVPYTVKRVVPHVTLSSVLQTVRGWAEHAQDSNLLNTIDRFATHVADAQELEPCLLHGDYHFANVLLHEGQIGGILDWEFAAYGDPHWDVVAAYQLLVEFEAASAAERFLNVYLEESGRIFEGPPLWHVAIQLQAWALSAWLRTEIIAGRRFDFRMAEVVSDQYEEREARVLTALAYLG
jgi:aminoglycoside phosphotransferase (APT) family kinase protein